MRGLFETIVGKLTGTKGLLRGYFKPLDAGQPGLSRQVVNYVLTGEGGSVLSTLSTQNTATAWRNQPRSYPHTTPALQLLDAGDADAALVRYGEVMAMLEPSAPHGQWGMVGTALTPDWLRHALPAHDYERKQICAMSRLERLAELGGASSVAILDILFHPGPGVYYGAQNCLDLFSGADAWLADHVGDVVTHHGHLDAAGRVGLARAVGRFGLADRYVPLLIDYGLSNAKTVRAAAIAALTAVPRDALAAALADRYGAAKPAARASFVMLAVGALGVAAGPLLLRWREQETDKRPLDEIDRALGNVALTQEASPPQAEASDDSYVALDGSTVTLPAHGVTPGPSVIPDSVFALLRPTIDSFNNRLRILQEDSAEKQSHWHIHSSPITERDLKEFKRVLEGASPIDAKSGQRGGMSQLQWWTAQQMKWDRAGLAAFYAHPALTERHLLTALRLTTDQLLPMLGDAFDDHAARALRQRLSDGADIRVVVDIWVQLGGRPPVREYLEMR